ncbi:UNVERIFIED_ORG: hypothetical protein J2X79_003787 [Arthrobacter globiformis]|nr:hypothetical protein [Arthrobacter globiformis]
MMNADDETNNLLEVLRRLGRSLVDQYVRGVTMQYRYLIDGPPQADPTVQASTKRKTYTD